jgi:leucyl-tRNA synthetase
LADLDQVNWPQEVKEMQRNWIGKSEGMEFDFPILNSSKVNSTMTSVKVFTTRPETIYGVTFVAIGPNHPLLDNLNISDEQQALLNTHRKEFLKNSQSYSKVETAIKSLDTFARVIHPITNDVVPVLLCNYVLDDYGTGAVMGVPAHDDRDQRVAEKWDLPVKVVLDQQFLNQNNQEMSGMAIPEAITRLKSIGRSHVQYRLRDWLISRQRHWGCPIPIVHCKACGPVPVPKEQLPLVLPTSRSAQMRKCQCPKCNGDASYDSDTMDTFMDSSWYYFRYLDSKNMDQPFSPDSMKGMPVDIYIGGIEHAILHLLYARFISKFVHQHMVKLPRKGEPFNRFLALGMVHGRTYRDPLSGRFLKPEEIDSSDPKNPKMHNGEAPDVSFEKMSKSKHNGVAPEDVIQVFGSDVIRAYITAKAPPEQVLEWDEQAVVGYARWLNRVYTLCETRAPLFDSKVHVNDQFESHIGSYTEEERNLWAATNELNDQVRVKYLNLNILDVM